MRILCTQKDSLGGIMKTSVILACLLFVIGSVSSFAVDTSGSSVQNQSQRNGPVTVVASPIPRKSSWNIGNGGFSVEYKWMQINDPAPQKNNIGFWVSLNSISKFEKASSYKCDSSSQSGYGRDTSGNKYYVCSASFYFSFSSYPELMTYAYNEQGNRNVWDVLVAVSLDDNGNWDSLDGKNYSFRF
jgi:hypothetical protein